MDTVIDNIEALKDIISARWTLSQSRQQLFDHIFEFLSDRQRSISPAQRQRLQSIPLILVGSELLPTHQLFFRLQNSLGPFAFEVPEQFLKHSELLKLIGVEDHANPERLTDILFGLAKTKNSHKLSLRLNPSELLAVVRLLDCIVSHGAQDSLGAALYVPDIDGFMVCGKECVYNDDHYNVDHIDKDKAKLKLASPLLSPNMCKKLGIRPLSHAVKAVLAPATSSSSDVVQLPDATILTIGRVCRQYNTGGSEKRQQDRLAQLPELKIYTRPELRIKYMLKKTIGGLNFFRLCSQCCRRKCGCHGW